MFTLPADPRQWGDTAFWPAFTFFLLWAWALVAILGDSYYTGIGLAKGFVEGNPISRWLFKKVGMALTTFIGAVVVMIIGTIFSTQGYVYGDLFLAIVAAAETYMVYRNRKLLGLKW